MYDEAPKPELLDREPVMVVAGITALAEAIIAALVIFGAVDWDAAQVSVLMALVGAVLALAGGWLARGHVYTPASVDGVVEKTTAKVEAEHQLVVVDEDDDPADEWVDDETV